MTDVNTCEDIDKEEGSVFERAIEWGIAGDLDWEDKGVAEGVGVAEDKMSMSGEIEIGQDTKWGIDPNEREGALWAIGGSALVIEIGMP